ncbi:MAG: Ldh family oxidoreductase [Gammaproteobacteria bacterium]|nr:Ldh family oxidoreductase [Gammaproteobacteria bacterium]
MNVPAEQLFLLIQTIFERSGLSQDHAYRQAEILIWANLRGIDSHGVLRIPRYIKFLKDGQMNPTPNINVISETSATVMIDGDQAPGVISMRYAMKNAISKAKSSGVGWALVRQTTHSGALGYYTKIAAEEGMAGIAIMTSRPNMAYFGSSSVGVATSPISIAVPGGPNGCLMLDMSSSALALGKIKDSLAKGVAIPENSALTKDGRPTTDPAQAAIPLPLGGAKGSGLSLMFETLTSLIAGNPLLEPTLSGQSSTHSQNGLAIAVNIEVFTSIKDYKELVTNLCVALKSLPTTEKNGEILLPGDPEQRRLKQRQIKGIPLPKKIWHELSTIATSLEIEIPTTS